MKRSILVLIVASAVLVPLLPQKTGSAFAGRWDLTLSRGTERFPSWLEVVEKGGKLEARAQLRTGNVNPVAALKTDGGRLILTVAAAAPARPAEGARPASPARPEMVWELTAQGARITGVQRQGDNVYQLAGVRAPALKRNAPTAWAESIDLFNGKDLTGWKAINNTPGTEKYTSHWVAKNGELVNEDRGSNLRTVREFGDFKLHVEFNCPREENSGIYIRGRYEAQVIAPPQGPPRPRGPGNPYLGLGSIYGMVGPSTPPPGKPDWQVYDITLIGRWVTVVFNGVTTVDNQEIPGITGGALDSNEAANGPIYLQGDHHGGIHYRNIKITLPKRTGISG